MIKLAESKGTAAACLRFGILTAARSGEARGAQWSEIDLDAGTWIVPGDRMKTGEEHRVPLSSAAASILRAAWPPDAEEQSAKGLVFPGGKAGRPLSDVALNKALATAGAGDFTVHGMRSTFRDWTAENTQHPRELAEASLAHANPNKVEAAYRRSDLLEKRRQLMQDWSDHCTGKAEAVAQKTQQQQ
jgi:integrase